MDTLAELLESQSVLLMASTIPPNMTISEWRRSRAGHTGPPGRRLRSRLLDLGGVR